MTAPIYPTSPKNLPEADEWRSAILASSLDCIITMDAAGRVVEFNGAAERVFGYTAAEVQGRDMAELIIPARYRERHRAGLAHHLATGDRRVLGKRIEVEGMCKDGRELPLELTITRLGTSGSPLFTAFIRDLTETRKAQAAQRESEAKFKLLFEKSSDAILLLDREGFIECNAAAVEMIRCGSEEELLRLHPSAISPPFQPDGRPSFEKANEMIALALATGSHCFEWMHRRADGEDFPCDILLTGIRLGNRQLLYAVLRDITERKRAESELRDRADRVVRYQSALMELTKSDLSDVEAALRDVTANDARTLEVERVSVWFFNEPQTAIVCRALYEASAQRYSAGMVLEAAHFPRYFAALATQRTIAADAAASDPATSEFRAGYLEPLGISAMLDVPIWRHGRMIGVVCHEHVGGPRQWRHEEQDFAASIADVIALALEASERRQAEKALHSSEARFRIMFERSPDALALFDSATGCCVDCNEEALRLWKATREEVIGRHPWDLAPPRQSDGRSSQESALAMLTEVNHAGAARFEWLLCRCDCTEFPAEISMTAMEFADRPMLLAVVRDLTRRKETEAEIARVQASLERRVEERTAELEQANEILRQQHMEVERANRAKSEFLSRMSHELRTPMNSILGFGQVLARKAADDQRKHVQHILDAGRHLLELINEVLDISRIEADQLRLSSEPVALANVVQEAVNLVQHLAIEREVTISDHLQAEGVFVMADRQRLTQVLVNLLSNGVKYNRRGGNVTIHCLPVGERVQIAVSDTGRGIPAEKLDRLFNPFDRLGAEDSDVEGTGLGLALSKRLVEHMGGALRVSSKEGVGTDFWIELPLAEDPRAGLQARREGATGRPSTLAGGQRFPVLYIEDNVANVNLVETLFADFSGIDLLVETRGEAGLARAVEVLPRLILLDMHLPDQSGDQVLLRLKGDPRTARIPVVVVSADATASHIKAVLAAGASHYLTKPLDVDRFLAVVEATLHPGADA